MPASLYLDACATTPPAAAVLQVMAEVQATAWANPSSLHSPGLAAAEALERARQTIGALLGCRTGRIVFTSGGSESIHLALLGAATAIEAQHCTRRLLISAVEHPATLSASHQLEQRGWDVVRIPVDQQGFLNLNELEAWLEPPTRLVSLIWGQSEVGTVQPIQAIGELCRRHGVPIHVDAVQILGHRTICFDQLPVDLLSGTAHKLQGPRGVGLLLVAPDQPLLPLIGGGGQEGGLRAGSEPVALVAGFAAALQQAVGRLAASAGDDPIAPIRDQLLIDCLGLRGLRLSGPDPRQDAASRLPHHLSLLVSTCSGTPLNGRDLVRELNDLGIAASSGSACSSRGSGASPVLLALGYGQQEAMSGLRLSLGPWLGDQELRRVPTALSEAIRRVEWKASQ